MMIKVSCLAALLAGQAVGQHRGDDVPYQNPQVAKQLEKQAVQFYQSAAPAVSEASKSVVDIRGRSGHLAFGTVVDDKGGIITKWSDIQQSYNMIGVATSDGQKLGAAVEGIYPEWDLALLRVDGELEPVDFSASREVELGDMLVMAWPYKRVGALGVVSVLPRSLQQEDQGYLGVRLSPEEQSENGVILSYVQPGSPADLAGIEVGDSVVKVGSTPIRGFIELQNKLRQYSPGELVRITVKRDGKDKMIEVEMGSRGVLPPEGRVAPERMQVMERMGTDLSAVRDGFANVLQTDMPLRPEDAGALVVGLDGKPVGIALARASRIKSYILPMAQLEKILASKARPLAEMARPQVRYYTPRTGQPATGPRVRYRIQPRANSRTHQLDPSEHMMMDMMRDMEMMQRQMEQMREQLRQNRR
ncbi:PDZ domain-containing protein [Persicirhabdus sediminis]|uniref:PDZ domain-containing protein n=1 Tax=Persicirhabdus sediminis TaxID=454144 RepID=A0A8J7SNE3_9BACT|nr:PDZ domain-containing protein [Persicirhabdus sediminis]MBK1791628.1 PDZ domain-containing protein [Persicirhabdus sediminis]